jgi:hypothetical protein
MNALRNIFHFVEKFFTFCRDLLGCFGINIKRRDKSFAGSHAVS